MDEDKELYEGAPGATRAYESSHRLAAAFNAVPRYEELTFEGEDGWDYRFKRYEYTPLTDTNEIRLLRLHPLKDTFRTANPTEVLPRCEIVHINLDSSPTYAAISYAWGDPMGHSPVLVHPDQCLTVTHSLFEALCSFRGDEPLDFWADQLCINQYDLTERSRQVQIMGKIFGQAVEVFVWLGRREDDSDSALTLIRKLDNCGISRFESFEYLNSQDSHSVKSTLQPQGISFEDDEHAWNAIMKLSLRPWFSRLWTLQEVVVARDPWFLCGGFSCNLNGMLRAFYLTQLQGQECTIGMTNVELLWICRSRFYSDSGLHLSELLRKVSNGGYECTKPHDRVYALLALQERRNLCNIEIDYEKTIQEIFIDTARAVIHSTR